MNTTGNRQAADYRKGFLCVIISTSLYGLMPTISMLGYRAGLNMFNIIFGRCALSLLIYVLMVFFRGTMLRIERRQLGWIMLMSLCGLINIVAVFGSYQYLPAGIASLMAMMYIVFVILIEIVLRLTKPNREKFMVLLASFAGILLILWNPGEVDAVSLRGIGLGLLGSLSYSFSVIMVGHRLVRDLPLETIFFYETLPSLIAAPLLAVCSGVSVFPAGWAQWGSCAVLAICNSFFAMVAFYTAIRLIGPGNAALLGTFEPLVSSLAGVVVLGDVLSVRSLAGGCVIMAAIFAHHYCQKRMETQLPTEAS